MPPSRSGARGSLEFEQDPSLCGGNLGFKEVKTGGSGRAGWKRILKQTRLKNRKRDKEEEERKLQK